MSRLFFCFSVSERRTVASRCSRTCAANLKLFDPLTKRAKMILRELILAKSVLVYLSKSPGFRQSVEKRRGGPFVHCAPAVLICSTF